MSVYVIAEAGVNHNGDIGIAKQLVDKAKEAGADCIKFQTFIAENIVSKQAGKAEYQKKETGAEETQYEMLKKLELSFKEFAELRCYCDQMGIDFLSTPFDIESIEYLKAFNMKFWKIPSGEITNLPYLIRIAELKGKVILSTGMSDMEEVRAAVAVLEEYGAQDIIVLHCTTEYPTPYTEVNLKAMVTMKNKLNIRVGYSDHTRGNEVSIAAVAMGAEVIEKHFTLDRDMRGPDHKASLEPGELKTLVKSIRNIESSLGDGKKGVMQCEKSNKEIVRKSIVAYKRIKKNEKFSDDNLTTKRPGNGISPMRWFDIIGKKSDRDYEEDEMIKI